MFPVSMFKLGRNQRTARGCSGSGRSAYAKSAARCQVSSCISLVLLLTPNLSFHAFYNSGYGIMNSLVNAKCVGMNEVAQVIEMQESKI